VAFPETACRLRAASKTVGDAQAEERLWFSLFACSLSHSVCDSGSQSGNDKFAEIRLRACIRIGEISRELETHQGLRSNDETKSKEQTLKDAGISRVSAFRYEELTGGREEQAQAVAATWNGEKAS
jgi:hypothetical protein